MAGVLRRLRDWLLGPRVPAPYSRATTDGANPEGGDQDSDDEQDHDAEDEGPEQGAPVALRLGDTFDLHTFAPRDVVSAAQAYLDEARGRGFGEVRLIHGRGKGVQRAAIRRMLAQRPDVLAFADAPAHLGGWGATMVQLRPGKSSPTARATTTSA